MLLSSLINLWTKNKTHPNKKPQKESFRQYVAMHWQSIRASKGRGVVHIKKTFIIFLDKNYKSYDRATSKNHLQYGSKFYAHMAHFVRKSFRALLDEILIRPLNVLLNYAGLSLLKSPIEGNLVVSKLACSCNNLLGKYCSYRAHFTHNHYVILII